ncbi:hypothetical protein OG756_34635 [Streptomyces sp. NBC_01310]|nr:hypothetical protein OG756_34635 [Streptomyces sp. NBC_01310]
MTSFWTGDRVRLRDHVFFAGRHHDLVVMGMLADEFAQLHAMGELD